MSGTWRTKASQLVIDIDIVDGTTNVSFCLGRCLGYLKKYIKNLLPARCHEQEVFLCDLAPNLDDDVHVTKHSFGVQQFVRRKTTKELLADSRGFFKKKMISLYMLWQTMRSRLSGSEGMITSGCAFFKNASHAARLGKILEPWNIFSFPL